MTGITTASHGTVVVPCEPLNEYLAITPGVGGDDRTGEPRLEAGFAITHRPSGYRFPPHLACLTCARVVGRRIAGLNIDWSVITVENAKGRFAELPSEVHDALINALACLLECQGRLCDDAAVEEIVSTRLATLSKFEGS